MKEIHKSALWALISIPITMLGIALSFALTHGAWPLLLIFYIPGLLVLWVIGDADPDSPVWLGMLIAFTSQYIGYFLIIHGTKKLIKWYKTHNKSLESDAG